MDKLFRASDKMIVGIPSKGRPKEHVAKFLREKGYHIPDNEGRKLQTTFKDMPNHRIAFLHSKDIPHMVERGYLDIGFTGLDLLYETKAKVRPVIKLRLGVIKMVIAVHRSSKIFHPFHLLHKSIATPFPNIANEYFERLKIPVTIRTIFGTSEVMGYFNDVDAIIDVSETGKTIEENNMKIITNDVFDSELVCIVKKPEHRSNHHLVHEFLRRIY